MFKNISKLFKSVDKPVACADSAEPKTPGRRGRVLTAQALAAHDAVAAALTDTPQTRSAVLAAVTDEALRAYAHQNWQNLLARLVHSGRAALATDSKSRGRNVTYVRK